MRRYLLVLFLLSLALSACAGTPADDLVKEVVKPAATPTMGESITFSLNVEVILTNGTDIISVFYLGPDQFGKEQWTCVSFSNQNCAERHGEDTNMVFYLNQSKIGETSASSAMFSTDWKVVTGQ